MKVRGHKQRDRAQQESERLLHLLADAAPVMIWMSDTDELCTYFNRRWLDFTGRPAESQLGDGWTGCIHPDDLKRRLDRYAEHFDLRQEFKMEYRLRRHDGEYRWVFDTGVPRFSADGSFAGYVGCCFDITESRRAAEALSTANARLIEAQEQERARIAHELHDNIGASLAILGIELLRAGQPVSDSPGETHPSILDLCQKMQEIAKQISRLSHHLHSSALQYLGLAQAIKAECRVFSERFRIPASCSCRDVPGKLDQNVALSLLRVTQEALLNAAKHSGAAKIEVEVTASPALLTLVVRDDGKGFDVEQSRLAAGLGLISMRERIRLVGGEFEIRSQAGQGTEVICRVPPGAGTQEST